MALVGVGLGWRMVLSEPEAATHQARTVLHGLAGFGLICGAAAWGLPTAWRRSLLACLAGAFLAAMAADAYVFHFVAYQSDLETVTAPAPKFAKPSPLRWIEEHPGAHVPIIAPVEFFRHQGERATLAVETAAGPRRVLPLGGIALRPTVYCEECEGMTLYDSDERGFRNPRGLWDGQAAELVVVGDSFAQGACVASDAGLVEPLRALFPRTVNLAMAGNGPLSMLAALEEFGPVLRPKTVLYVYWARDLPRLLQEARHPILNRYLEEEGFRQGLAEMQPAIDAAMMRMAFPGNAPVGAGLAVAPAAAPAASAQTPLAAPAPPPRLRLIDMALLRHVRQLFGIALRDSDVFAQYRKTMHAILRKARTTTERWGGRLEVVYLPEPWRDTPLAAELRRIVLAAAARNGVPVIDAAPALSGHDRESLYCPTEWTHFNRQGYGLIGTVLADTLRSPR